MSQYTGLRRFAKDSVFNLIQQIWAIGVSLLTTILLARGLGVADRGAYAVVVLLAGLVVMFVSASVEPPIMYFAARDEYPLVKMVRGVLALTLWVSLLGVVMALMLIFAAHDWLFPGIPVNDLLLSILLIPTTLFAAHLTSLFRGLQDFRTYNWIEMVSQPLALLLTLALVWWLRLGVLGAILAITGRYVLALGMCIIILRRRLGDQRILVYELDRAYARQMLAYGFRAYWYYIVTFLNQRADIFLLNLFGVGAVAIGLYDVAVTLGERMWVLSRSVSMVTFSRTAALEKMEAERTALTTIAARYTFWLGLAGSVLVFLLADWAVVLLYGIEYRPSALALRLLLPGIVTLGMGHVLSNDIAGRGKPEVIAAQSAFAVVLNIFLNLVLIPRLNFPGASIASVISYTAQALLLILTFCRLSSAHWTELFIPTRADFRRMQTAFRWGITKLRRPSVIEP